MILTTKVEKLIKYGQKYPQIKSFIQNHATYLFFYLLGYFEISIAWWFLICLINQNIFKTESPFSKDDYNDSSTSFAKKTNEIGEEKSIKSKIKVEDLPAWFIFPDKEKVEWINILIKHYWVNKSNVIKEKLTKGLKSLNKSGKFNFDVKDLGSIPPKITGVKVYTNNIDPERKIANYVVIDLDLDFNMIDCDIGIITSVTNFKMKNFQLKGLLRVIFTSFLDQAPYVGGMKLYFAEMPEVKIEVEGILGDLNVNLVEKLIKDNLRNKMVNPHKITKSFTKLITSKSLKCPEYSGVLGVKLNQARNLFNNGSLLIPGDISDPYAIITLGEEEATTGYIPNSLNPTWNFLTYFPIDELSNDLNLNIEVKDHNPIRSHANLGKISLSVSEIASKRHIHNEWRKLDDVDTGEIEIALSWWVTSKNKNDLDDNMVQCSLLQIFIESCHNLTSPDLSHPSPFVKLYVDKVKDAQVTRTKKNKVDPSYGTGFVFTIFNPKEDILHLRVIDTSTGNEPEIGFLDLALSEIIDAPNMELYQQRRSLKGDGTRSHGEISFSANIRALKKVQDASSTTTTATTKNQTEKVEDTFEIFPPTSPPAKISKERGRSTTIRRDNSPQNPSSNRISNSPSASPLITKPPLASGSGNPRKSSITTTTGTTNLAEAVKNISDSMMIMNPTTNISTKTEDYLEEKNSSTNQNDNDDNEKSGNSSSKWTEIAIQRVNQPPSYSNSGTTSTPSQSPLIPARASTSSRSPTPPSPTRNIAEAVRKMSQTMMNPIMIQEISETDYDEIETNRNNSLSEEELSSVLQQPNENSAVSNLQYPRYY